VVQQTIDIPRIAVVPTGEVTTGFHPFKLGSLPNFQPGQREIVGQELRTNHQFTMSREAGIREQRFEDYIVKKLIDYDDIDYFTQAELLYDLAGQAVAHYQAQNYSENELHEVFHLWCRARPSDPGRDDGPLLGRSHRLRGAGQPRFHRTQTVQLHGGGRADGTQLP
jgi:hypothetical protein